MASKTHMRLSGTWREIKPLHGRYSGSWREIQKGYAKHAGVWRTIYLKSDPQTLTVDSTWHAVYNGENKYTGSQRDRLGYQGHQSSFSRLEGTLYGFDYAAVQAFLTLRPNVSLITVESECRWSYYGSGKNFDWSSHEHASAPASGPEWRSIDVTTHYTRGQRKTVTLPSSTGAGWLGGTIKGLALPYTGSSQEWGYMAATYTTTILVASPSDSQTRIANGGEKPRLRITADF